MVSVIFITILLYLSLAVNSATSNNSTGFINSTILFQNAQEAQNLNTQFEALSLNDSCNASQTACIYKNLANCVNGAWETTKCLSSQECFALPSVNKTGTVVRCTSELSALSLMNATGVNGLFALNISANVSTNEPENGNDSIASTSISVSLSLTTTFSSTIKASTASTSIASAPKKVGVEETLTITSYIPFNSAGVATLPAVTQILDVAEAQVVIESLVAKGGKLVA